MSAIDESESLFSQSKISASLETEPFWSVMIPSYNPRRDYMEEAIRSVLAQDPGPERMQIQVVDDCSTKVDVFSMVRDIAGERVTIVRNPKNLGLADCWNACAMQARGSWVHILHQDDYILPGFYERLETIALAHPKFGLVAARSLFVDEQGIIKGVTPRLRNLESGGHSVADFFYVNPLQCPGIVVRRAVYTELGGFRKDLKFTLDCEMWARVIGSCGGVVVPEVLAAYRSSPGNETYELGRTAETLTDFSRLSAIFADRYSEFDAERAKQEVCKGALVYAKMYSRRGDQNAALANLRYWRRNAPLKRRVRVFIVDAFRSVFG